MKLAPVDEAWAAALRIPKRKGDAEVGPPLGGTRAATGDDVGADDAEARDDEAVAPLAVMLSCDMPASTHVGELWRAARRRSTRATEHRVTIWILTERSPCRFSLNPRWPHDHSTTRVDADPSCSVILCVGEVRLNHYLIITLVPEPSHS